MAELLVNELTVNELYELEYGKEAVIEIGGLQIKIARNASGDYTALLLNAAGGQSVHKYLDHAIGYVIISHYHQIRKV